MTSSEPRCPTCQAIRPVGANFCAQCGTSFAPWGDSSSGGPSLRGPFDIPMRTAIKIGAGLAIGVALVVVAVYSILLLIFAVSMRLA